MYFPNLDELSFLIVLAFPKAENHEGEKSQDTGIFKIIFNSEMSLTSIQSFLTFQNWIGLQNLLLNP